MFKLYIDGELVEGRGRKTDIVCPGTEEVVGEVAVASEDQAQRALEAAKAAFPAWSALTVEQRGEWMIKLRDAILAEKDKLADIMARETGKLIAQAAVEIDTMAGALDFFLNQAKANNDEVIRDPKGQALYLTIREPLGVVVGYLAWNFPLSNLTTKLAPVLASGCTAVLKPATKTPLSTLYLGEIMHKMDFPKGVINFVVGSAREISSVLTKSTIPAMISIIGSSKAGRELVRDSATSIKRFSLELGGNAPVIVTQNADIGVATDVCIGGKLRNCGQICTSPQRVFVERGVHDAFVAALKEKADAAKCGTLYEECDIGPLITAEAVPRMEELVKDALDKGAKLVSGGKRPAYRDKGNYFELTVLDAVTTQMRAFSEEVFGPILAVMAYDDLDAAIRMANDTEYGLTSYAFTSDIMEANRIARGLQFGTVVFNGAVSGSVGGSHLPHGGIKESGVGKDWSHYSLDEYYYIKSIRIPVR